MTTAIILAGGLGTRLSGAVPDLPKPMAPIRGRPFLEHQMDYWIAQGIDQFILSVGYKRDLIMARFGAQYRGVPVNYAVEEQPLGTGGGLLLAARELTVPFLLLNGDTFFEVNLEALTTFHNDRSSQWTFALFRTSDTRRYMGMDVAGDGRIRSPAPIGGGPNQLANGGVYLVNPAALVGAPAGGTRVSLEEGLLPEILNSGRLIYGMECEGRFIDIGIPADYFRASEVLP